MKTETKELNCKGCNKKLTVLKIADRDFLKEYFCMSCKIKRGEMPIIEGE
jgi:hypothetical protein